ncbi:MAG: hypothetical protein K2X36_01740 [Microbacteriaceae bacterium]|nr:hypothetical protein [Microbacteriaceae bacterium]
MREELGRSRVDPGRDGMLALDVNAENPADALGVYTRLRFAPTDRDVSYRVIS